MELDDVLSDKAPEAPAETVEKPEAPVDRPESIREVHRRKEHEAAGRDPATGKFVPKEPKEEKPEAKPEVKPEVKAEVKQEPKKEEFTEKERAFLRGLEEERRKRQDLERQIAELRKPPEQKPDEKKSFWDDPEGHFKSFEQRLAQREQALSLQVSEKLARSRYNDFDEKIGEFAESLRTTPGLHAQWLASPDPAEFAYRHGQRIKEMRDVGSIEDYKKKIETETRARLEAEFKAKQEELEKKRAELPGSLSDVRGTTTQQRPVYSGPTPLDDILGRKS